MDMLKPFPCPTCGRPAAVHRGLVVTPERWRRFAYFAACAWCEWVEEIVKGGPK